MDATLCGKDTKNQAPNNLHDVYLRLGPALAGFSDHVKHADLIKIPL